MKHFTTTFYISSVLVLLSIFTSCNSLKKQAPSILNDENLPDQTYVIDNSVENILTGEKGTRLRIPKNTFSYANGDLIEGEIQIELKEAISAPDIILANLSTTFNGAPLQTGGMIYINAKGENGPVKINDDKSILTLLPTDSILENMSVFEGIKDESGKIIWVAPKPINSSSENEQEIIRTFERSHNIMYTVFLNNEQQETFPDSIETIVAELAWEGTGLKITRDSTFPIGDYTINFLKQDQLFTWTQTFESGSNAYISDYNLSYIFNLKKLGWANIDRLYSDPRTEEINLITTFSNQKEFDLIQTTLITESMYLPGYQRKDNTFGFTHGDFEKTQLPIGAKATIIGTSNVNDEIYFGLQTFEIGKDQKIEIKLKKSNSMEMELALNSEL